MLWQRDLKVACPFVPVCFLFYNHFLKQLGRRIGFLRLKKVLKKWSRSKLLNKNRKRKEVKLSGNFLKLTKLKYFKRQKKFAKANNRFLENTNTEFAKILTRIGFCSLNSSRELNCVSSEFKTVKWSSQETTSN